MGNIFRACDDSDPSQWLSLSNGGTDVFFDVMTLAVCARAVTPWQRHLALWFADGHRHSRGFAGFDLADLAWSEDWRSEHAFFCGTVALAGRRHRWDQLDYDPPFAEDYLRDYTRMLAGFTPRPRPGMSGEWGDEPVAQLLRRCARHDVYEGYFGCRFCDPQLRTLDG